MEQGKPRPGFYDAGHRTKRFWDGEDWTDTVVYDPPAEAQREPLSFVQLVFGTTLGFLLGWALVYLGAQAEPDNIYWPVKFVVEDLPTLP
jgi:hypothetical protein